MAQVHDVRQQFGSIPDILGARSSRVFVTVLMLTVMLFVTSASVYAEPVPPGGDTFQMQCRDLQQRAKELVAEYGRVAEDPNLDLDTKNRRLAEIIQELRSIGYDWRDIGCQAVWGDIFPARWFPGRPTGGVTVPPTGPVKATNDPVRPLGGVTAPPAGPVQAAAG